MGIIKTVFKSSNSPDGCNRLTEIFFENFLKKTAFRLQNHLYSISHLNIAPIRIWPGIRQKFAGVLKFAKEEEQLSAFLCQRWNPFSNSSGFCMIKKLLFLARFSIRRKETRPGSRQWLLPRHTGKCSRPEDSGIEEAGRSGGYDLERQVQRFLPCKRAILAVIRWSFMKSRRALRKANP